MTRIKQEYPNAGIKITLGMCATEPLCVGLCAHGCVLLRCMYECVCAVKMHATFAFVHLKGLLQSRGYRILLHACYWGSIDRHSLFRCIQYVFCDTFDIVIV